MFEVTIEAEAIEQILDAVSEKIVQFGKQEMSEGLTRWQTDDMNRKHPNTEQSNDDEVYTLIWPTSRLSMQRGTYRRKIGRPILRPELKRVLCERMQDLMEEKITWGE
jgi:hypothetical protein